MRRVGAPGLRSRSSAALIEPPHLLCKLIATLRLWPRLGTQRYIDDWRAWSAAPTLISNAPGADLGQGSALGAQRGLLLRRLLENRNACAAPFFSGLTLIAHAVDLCFHHVIFIYKRLLMATSCP